MPGQTSGAPYPCLEIECGCSDFPRVSDGARSGENLSEEPVLVSSDLTAYIQNFACVDFVWIK